MSDANDLLYRNKNSALLDKNFEGFLALCTEDTKLDIRR